MRPLFWQEGHTVWLGCNVKSSQYPARMDAICMHNHWDFVLELIITPWDHRSSALHYTTWMEGQSKYLWNLPFHKVWCSSSRQVMLRQQVMLLHSDNMAQSTPLYMYPEPTHNRSCHVLLTSLQLVLRLTLSWFSIHQFLCTFWICTW